MVNEQFSRKRFLQISGTTAALVAVYGAQSCAFESDKFQKRQIRLNTLDEAMVELKKLQTAANVTVTGPWSLSHVFNHLAQSIEYSMTGFPENKPAIIRNTIGKIVLFKFLSQGYMNHNLTDPIPGAPALEDAEDIGSALARLKKSILDFQNFQGQTAPHFVYGPVSKQDYDRLHAYHIANHLCAVELS